LFRKEEFRTSDTYRCPGGQQLIADSESRLKPSATARD
jgi:hypothetical protein